MESEKRKRQTNAVDDDDDDARRTKPREDDDLMDKPTTAPAPATATVEAEVEEFFAILRRVHEVRYVQRDNDDESQSRKVTEKKKKSSQCWKPAFEWGDFEGNTNGVKLREKRDDAVCAFDLNAAPKS